MNNYTDKEKKIIKQCHEGPYYKVVTEITNNEFNDLVDKLLDKNDKELIKNILESNNTYFLTVLYQMFKIRIKIKFS